MTLSDLYKTLESLHKLKALGGKHYSEVAKLLTKEATTHNCGEASKLLAKLQSSVNSLK